MSEMDAADRAKLNSIEPGAINTQAGAGLTRSGSTLDVVANADGSIVVGADDIRVGVLATDAQHGSRGGGSLHSTAVPSGDAGFISGANQAKLDGIAAGAQVSVLRQTVFLALAVDASRAVAGFATLLSQPITISAGGVLILQFDATVSNTSLGSQTFFRYQIDGVTVANGGASSTNAVLDGVGTVSLTKRVTGLAVGARTVTVQWSRSAGTSNIRPVTVPDGEHASLLLTEVSA